MEGDWARGPTGTGEFSWGWSENFGPASWAGLLAESYEMPDSTTVIFHIRKGVSWALNLKSEASRLVNGRELTADDVVWNIKRIYIDMPISTRYGMLGESRPTTGVNSPNTLTTSTESPWITSSGIIPGNHIGALAKSPPMSYYLDSFCPLEQSDMLWTLTKG